MNNFSYDPLTGYLYKNNSVVGFKNKNGYLYYPFQGKSRLVHRIIYYLVYGKYPEKDIDHIDGNRSNNVWTNLREVTRSQNLMNRKSSHDLPKNVYRFKNKFRIKMKINGITENFGYYDDFELASLVAREVQNKYHGEYARKV